MTVIIDGGGAFEHGGTSWVVPVNGEREFELVKVPEGDLLARCWH